MPGRRGGHRERRCLADAGEEWLQFELTRARSERESGSKAGFDLDEKSLRIGLARHAHLVKGSRAAVEAVFNENGQWDLLDLFAELRCPTLLVRAEVARGGIVAEEAVSMAKADPLVRVVTIPEADHNIHRGRFDAFMAEVEPFLAGV